jgi:hypothetical protein
MYVSRAASSRYPHLHLQYYLYVLHEGRQRQKKTLGSDVDVGSCFESTDLPPPPPPFFLKLFNNFSGVFMLLGKGS